jgi:AcrR family transcriptional regulator
MSRITEPQNERSRRTRAAVLDAAWELLEEQGAQRTTMAAVADRAGVSRRALYLHFSSRADLLLALHDHIDERLDLAASIRPIRQATDAVAALEAFALHLGRFHPRILRLDLALLQAKRDDPDVAVLVAQGQQRWLEGCRGIVQRLAEEGVLAEPWTVDTAADLLWSFMFPEALERLTVERGWTDERFGDLLAVLLHRTLVAEGD